jgi:hypothetical protein
MADHHHYAHDLSNMVEAVGWPTPDGSAVQVGEGLETWMARRERLKQKGINGNGCGTPLSMAARMAGWPSPNAHDGRRPGHEDINSTQGTNLRRDALRWCGWATPTVQDAKNTAGPSQFERNSLPLNCEVHGATENSSDASTENRGALAPEFVCWLMGFPPEWERLRPTETPSSRK